MKRIKSMLQTLLFASLLSLGSIPLANAFQLKPITRIFAPTGQESTQAYEVVNDTESAIAIEIAMAERHIDRHGHETRRDASDDFLVYPEQILLLPGENQTVRVTWLGDPQPEQELAYRLIAEQVPIDLNQADADVSQPRGAITVLLNYIGSVYIRPDNVRPAVTLTSLSHQQGDDGSDQLVVNFHNQGTGRAVLKNLQLQLQAVNQSASVTLMPEDLPDVNNGLILAGQARQFVMPWPENLPVGAVTGQFEFDADY